MLHEPPHGRPYHYSPQHSSQAFASLHQCTGQEAATVVVKLGSVKGQPAERVEQKVHGCHIAGALRVPHQLHELLAAKVPQQLLVLIQPDLGKLPQLHGNSLLLLRLPCKPHGGAQRHKYTGQSKAQI